MPITLPEADAALGGGAHAAPDRRGARQIRRRSAQGQARGRHRAPQPDAPAEAPAGDGRRGRAEEHPDDRPDRRRQDRDRAAPRAARAVAVHQGRSVEVHGGRLRRPRRRVDGPRPRGAGNRHGARGAARRTSGRRRGSTPRSGCSICCCRRADARRRRRSGGRAACATRRSTRASGCASSCATDGSTTAPSRSTSREQAFPSFEIISGSSVEEVGINLKEMLPGMFQGRTRKRKLKVPEALEQLTQEEEQKLVDMDSVARTAVQRVEQERHHLRRRDRQDRRARGRAGARTSAARACSATSCRSSRARPSTRSTGWCGPITSCSSPPARSTCPSRPISSPSCRAASRSAWSSSRSARDDFVRILTEPKNALVKQYIALLDTEGIDADVHRRGDRSHRGARDGGQREDREHRRAPPPHRDGKAARRDLVRRPGPRRQVGDDRRRLRAPHARRHRWNEDLSRYIL